MVLVGVSFFWQPVAATPRLYTAEPRTIELGKQIKVNKVLGYLPHDDRVKIAMFRIATATAAQRAEALCRVIDEQSPPR